MRYGQPTTTIVLCAAAALTIICGCGLAPRPSAAPESPTYKAALLAQGRQIFSTTCTVCHGQNGQGISGPALWGEDSAVSDFPSFSPLETFIQDNMPASDPGSLSPTRAEAVASFVWHHNHP